LACPASLSASHLEPGLRRTGEAFPVRSVLHFFLRLGVFGLLGMGLLDSSILFLPFGNDLLVVVLTARQPERFWLYAIFATLGSLMGCTVTDFLSRKIGQVGMEKMMNPKRLEHVQGRLKKHAFWVLGTAALMPPPFPFTVFLMAAAAVQISRWRLLTALAAGRFIRFVVIALLAVKFGGQIIALSKRDELRYFVIGLAVISIVGSAFSVAKWVRSSRSSHQRGPGAEVQAEA
jgi:membrane protein YqaA with SNARE-associated domain